MNVLVLLLTISLALITRAETQTTLLYTREGDMAKLNFSLPCDSARATLRHRYTNPFYDTNSTVPMPVSDRYEIILHNETEDHDCALQLDIDPVHRSDEGGYILSAYDGRGNFREDSRIVLSVEYPPGVASCEWLQENIVGDWGSVRCTWKTPAGSTPWAWRIACYQNGIRLPPRTTPTKAGNVLQQTIWVRYSQVAFCCASLQEKLNMCECKDFIWLPSHNGNITGPCDACAPRQDSQPTPTLQDHAENSSGTARSIPTPQTITKRPAGQIFSISMYVGLLAVIGGLSCIIFVLCVCLAKAFWKIRQIRSNGPCATGPADGVQLETVV